MELITHLNECHETANKSECCEYNYELTKNSKHGEHSLTKTNMERANEWNGCKRNVKIMIK